MPRNNDICGDTGVTKYIGTGAAPALPPVPDEAWVTKLPLEKRLILEHPVGEVDPVDGTANAWVHRNPDGPEAAAELTRLRDIAGELARAVKPFAAAAVIIEADRKIWIERPVNETGELEIEHFARARAAYAKYQQEQGL